MTISLKPLDQQVIAITGASSGIGLATALAAAELVLASRSARTLGTIGQMQGGKPTRDPEGALYRPSEDGRIHGSQAAE